MEYLVMQSLAQYQQKKTGNLLNLQPLSVKISMFKVDCIRS